MPNGGPKPDCVHCRHMARQANSTYRCNFHQIILHTPVRVFCKDIDYAQHEDWFDEPTDPKTLRPNMLYIWLEKRTQVGGETQIDLSLRELISVQTYTTWAADTFWRTVRNMSRDQNDPTDDDDERR